MTTELRRRWRIAAMVLTGALAAAVMTAVLVGGLTVARALLAMVAIAPLLAALPRLQYGARRAYAAMTLIIVPYLTLSLMETAANPQARPWAPLCLLLSFGLFVCLVANLRLPDAN